MFFSAFDPVQIFSWLIAFLTAFTIHEAAHAAAATYLGDPTPRLAGRLTLNPLAHLDPTGTIFLLLAGFGWGKPVPINPRNFHDAARGEFLVAVAGPLANLALALALAIPLNFLLAEGSSAWLFSQTLIYVNIVLLVFNLLPLFPLDGGNAILPFLPVDYQNKFQQVGPILLFSLLACDYIFGTSFLWDLLQPLTQIVWAGVTLATRFGV